MQPLRRIGKFVCLSAILALVVMGPPAIDAKPVAPATPQPVRIVVVEYALQGTPATAAAIDAVRQYAATAQDGRFRRVDVATADQEPVEVQTLVAAYKAASATKPWIFIVSEKSGKQLFGGEVPATPAAAVALAKKYGG